MVPISVVVTVDDMADGESLLGLLTNVICPTWQAEVMTCPRCYQALQMTLITTYEIILGSGIWK